MRWWCMAHEQLLSLEAQGEGDGYGKASAPSFDVSHIDNKSESFDYGRYSVPCHQIVYRCGEYGVCRWPIPCSNNAISGKSFQRLLVSP